MHRHELTNTSELMDNAKRPVHRGALYNPAAFAPDFVRGRIRGFQKDIGICLTGIPSTTRDGLTHAYFPALAACCSTLEYLAGLYLGKAAFKRALGHKDIADYSRRFLPQPDYDDSVIRILVDAFRHAVAHRGIATGVWVDQHPDTQGRRLVWKIYENGEAPAIQIKEDHGVIDKDPPWKCRYTHRVHIHLAALAKDICDSAERYLAALVAEPELQRKFMDCMKRLYPD